MNFNSLIKSAFWIATVLLPLFAAFPLHGKEEGFLQVTEDECRLSFPSDHGPHPGFRTEWWYYTGNVTDTGNRRFGFQLTFFRSGQQPPGKRKHWPRPASAWRTDQIYLAHTAVTDIAGGRHMQAEQMARPALSLAGAKQTDATVVIHTHAWQATIAPDGHQLRAATEEFALSLDLTPAKPPVLHGNNGYSRKGQSPERASCYYSFTRMKASGILEVNGTRHGVQGSAWMDHEFSTAPLQPGIIGWDWFSLQLADQTEVMIYLLRQRNGESNPASSGTVVLPSGHTRHLHKDDVIVTPLSFWTSPHTGGRYPVKWHLAVLPMQLELTVTANLVDQEMRTPRSTNVAYWEGSVQVRGNRDEKAIKGVGYVEMTGYAKPFDAPM